MPDTTITAMHSIDDNTGGSLGVMRHTGGVYLVIDDEGQTAAAGPFTRALLDGLLDAVGRAGRSTGPHLRHAAQTYGSYTRTAPDPDDMDGGVAAALIEEEEGIDAAASRLAAFARKLGVPPEWTTAPAVQAWHRSDHRTERDGTPGQPRIWSPDYKTTETWSTPSLRNVHWSDLVDVTPLAPVRECPDPDEHVRYDAALADAEKAERELHQARSERDELRSLYEGQIEVIGRLQHATVIREPRPLTAREHLEAAMKGGLTREDIPNDMCDRLVASRADTVRRPTAPGDEYPRRGVRDDLLAALTEPPARPEWADLGEALDRLWPHGTDGIAREDIARRLHTEAGVRVVSEDGAA